MLLYIDGDTKYGSSEQQMEIDPADYMVEFHQLLRSYVCYEPFHYVDSGITIDSG